jgi:hypothetical protein
MEKRKVPIVIRIDDDDDDDDEAFLTSYKPAAFKDNCFFFTNGDSLRPSNKKKLFNNRVQCCRKRQSKEICMDKNQRTFHH